MSKSLMVRASYKRSKIDCWPIGSVLTAAARSARVKVPSTSLANTSSSASRVKSSDGNDWKASAVSASTKSSSTPKFTSPSTPRSVVSGNPSASCPRVAPPSSVTWPSVMLAEAQSTV